jgi:TonB family protein
MPPITLFALLVVLAAQSDGSEAVRLNGRTAVPMGSANWIDPVGDFPPSARRAEEQGIVVVRVYVTGSGRVAGCRTLQSANVAALDRATCSILRRRARFEPFTDGGLATYDYRIFWDLSRVPPIQRPNLTETVS